MVIVSILSVLMFSTTLCIIEVPKMLKDNLRRELWAFSVLLGLGTLLVMLKGIDAYIPNPSDFMAWIFSPFADIIKSLLK